MSLFNPFRKQNPIDLTVFLGQWPFRYSTQATAVELLGMAEHLGITRMCVSHIASIFGHDTLSGNEALMEQTAGEERMWPFAILNPAEPGWERELAWVERSGARGIRLVPGYHEYKLGGSQAADLVEASGSLGLPLQICFRLEDERLQHTRYQAKDLGYHEVAELIVRVSGKSNILISGMRDYEWDAVLGHLPPEYPRNNVFVDLWYCKGPLAMIAALCQRNEENRMTYSSCFPLQTAEATALQLATADISDDERYAICRGNALRYLKIPDGQQPFSK